ncbi:MAG TPA: UDP-N-acetylmuramate dehydrogenase [Gemmatimonadales bacterium]|jgi:UDP-N-acetylmuramate dehydrogenase|nr:UDP-N-acetylmuramate dehydrogenase [Gemmatimonadales bacterium]
MDRVTARDPGFAQALRARLRGEVRENETLARYSTYRIGGPATVVLPASAEDVATALRAAHEAGVPWFALGLGSNILLPDHGLDALVIRLGKGMDTLTQDGECWTIGAGLPAPLAARRTAAAGFAGLHIFVGVPGTVGGGVYMNAGCHGGDWSEVVQQVTVIDDAGNDATLPRSEVPFTYRWSGLDGRIVVGTTVRLRPEPQPQLDEQIAEMFEWRQRGTPFNQPCCGSVFKNPSGPSWKRQAGPRTAGQLIEAAGLKGIRVGGAQVSPMHANYFVNTGNATAGDVRALIERVRIEVESRFQVRLEPEVKLIGEWGEYLNGER